jgi:hypothetical protein
MWECDECGSVKRRMRDWGREARATKWT